MRLWSICEELGGSWRLTLYDIRQDIQHLLFRPSGSDQQVFHRPTFAIFGRYVTPSVRTHNRRTGNDTYGEIARPSEMYF